MMRIIAIVMGGLLLSTPVFAAQAQKSHSSQPMAGQEISPQERLKLLREIHHHNEVFDNYHTGGIPYESFQDKKENKE